MKSFVKISTRSSREELNSRAFRRPLEDKILSNPEDSFVFVLNNGKFIHIYIYISCRPKKVPNVTSDR